MCKSTFVAAPGFAMDRRNSKLGCTFIFRTRKFIGLPEGQILGSIPLSIFF